MSQAFFREEIPIEILSYGNTIGTERCRTKESAIIRGNAAERA